MAQKVTVGEEIAKLAKLRAKRLRLQEQKDEADKAERDQKQLLFDMLKAEGLDKQAGSGLSCAISKQSFVIADDWEAVDRFVVRNKCPEIFQRRLSKEAVLEIQEQRKGKPVPGTRIQEKESLSVTAVKSKRK